MKESNEVTSAEDIKIGDFVKLTWWDKYFEVTGVDSLGKRIQLTAGSRSAWYDVNLGFIKQEEKGMKNEVTSAKQDEFQVGDTVWDILDGKGKVTAVVGGRDTYPVEVYFDNGLIGWFTEDGRHDEGYSVRSLFFSEPKIEAATTRPFVSTLVGKKVVVVPKYDTTVTEVLPVVKEDNECIYTTEEGHYWKKKDIAEMYEVLPENLLNK